MRRTIIIGVLGLLLGSLGFTPAAGAQVQSSANCENTVRLPVVHPGAEIFSFEGSIESYDLSSRILTVFGHDCYIPRTLLIDNDGDGAGELTLAQLLDPALEAQRSVIGASLQCEGLLVSVGPDCYRLHSTQVFVEMNEHVVVGALKSASPPSGRAGGGGTPGSFEVLEVPVVLNTDPRFSSLLIGAGGEPIEIADLIGFEGTLMEITGYFERGQMQATLVETDAFHLETGTDTVVITRSTWDASRGILEVRGLITPDPATGNLVTTCALSINVGPLPGSCGVFVGQVPVIPEGPLGFGEFRYRSSSGDFPQMPLSTCVVSPAGGHDDRDVEVD